jgi:uncharacterized protein YggU (UPF0235/DUF167 family)
MSPFFLPTSQGYLLRLTVVPGAQRTQVVGLHGDRLKVRLAAPPDKGAANLPKNSLKLTMGAQSRAKMVAVNDRSPEMAERLGRLLPDSSKSP